MPEQTAVAVVSTGLPVALQNAIGLWAAGSTDATSTRRMDLIRDKRRMVEGFFEWSGLHPAAVREMDVAAWQAELTARGLSPASIYGYCSRLSAWYDWALQDAATREHVRRNPVTAARPKAPKAYQSEKTKALTDDELLALLAAVKARADAGDLVGLRDYALLLSYTLTGFRREEVICWRGADVRLNGKMIVQTRVKGGDLRSRQVNDLVKTAVRAYLVASGRDPANLAPDEPIWLAHDRAVRATWTTARGTVTRDGQRQLTSHAFAKAMKGYAQAAGIDGFHLHALRHTYGSMVFEATGGDVAAAQYELGHKSQATTQIYLHRIAVRQDRYSGLVATKLGL